MKKFSDEYLINKIKEFHNKHNRVPRHYDCKDYKELPSASNLCERFGSWNNVLALAGLPTKTSPSARIKTKCLNCNLAIGVRPTDYRKSKTKNFFCSKSCAATYNNKNKSFGIRRSKLEKYIERKIAKDFPFLNFTFNNKEIIGSELDIYCPDLRIAIELNGIVHYEPIYGQDKFERIQDNDKQKLIECYKHGIELAVIDVSQCKYMTNKISEKYYNIIRDIIIRSLKRIE